MIFNITSAHGVYKRVAVIDEHNAELAGNPRPITQLAFDDRVCLRQIFDVVSQSEVEFTAEELKIFAQQVVDLLENSYQDTYEATPELLAGKQKLALVERSNPLYGPLVECLNKEQWTVVFAQEDKATFGNELVSSMPGTNAEIIPVFPTTPSQLRA